ncbi:MAG: AraC family transcriptional regulator [Thermoflexibacter sp.]|jgi:AraC-like DNA-binding protein|nr:AraC family transcriptional regulator [Thermoflexibacter sp.]
MTHLVTLFSAFALGHSIFLSWWSWQKASKKNAYLFLSCLLFALAIRLSKSILIIFFPHVPFFIPAVGLIGMSSIGVFLWFHVQTLLHAHFQWNKKRYLHFLPSLIITVWLLFSPSDMIIFYQYSFTALQILVYLLITIYNLYRKPTLFHKNKQWFLGLLGGISLIWIVFFMQLFINSAQIYLLITVTASFVLYGISFLAIQQQEKLFQVPSIEENKEVLNKIGESLKYLLEKEKLYKDPSFSVQKLAELLQTPPYLVSKAIKQCFQKTFPELMTQFRMREAEELLCSINYQHLSIEGIAQECGFRSPSAFYNAFKNYHHTTPAAFQKANKKSGVS